MLKERRNDMKMKYESQLEVLLNDISFDYY